MSGSSAAAELVVDARGRRCPLPVLDLARRIGEVAVGGIVEVLADDPAAGPDIAAWCRMRGHGFLGSRADGTTGSHRVRRGG